LSNKHLLRNLFSVSSIMIISILLLFSMRFVSADSTVLYLDWEMPGDIVGEGHLTISGFPTVMEENQTYKTEITITLDIGENINPGKFKFGIRENDELNFGYAFLNSTLQKGQSVTLISHWKIEDIPNNLTEGTLKIVNATANNNATLNTTPQDIKIKFRIESQLNLTVPKTLTIWGTLLVEGNVTKNAEGAKISITYLGPNGTEIVRGTSTDIDGNFNDEFKPDLEGTWWIKASWNGTEKYAAASSTLQSFEYKPAFPFLLALAIIGFSIWVGVTSYVWKVKRDTEQIYPSKEA
jgi:hypothetical protein